ncbi:hypothetical protein FRX31_027937 [Thalictrum thalictroides]|uniref:Uncharacterized protein n=1 Tax=Thalictrum thalictroides TaxID=46969 RepID=A0A7J6VCK4_THATH|nr:hypothetical protein FRX31_027937 [Thalictrum thalictroides]
MVQLTERDITLVYFNTCGITVNYSVNVWEPSQAYIRVENALQFNCGGYLSLSRALHPTSQKPKM